MAMLRLRRSTNPEFEKKKGLKNSKHDDAVVDLEDVFDEEIGTGRGPKSYIDIASDVPSTAFGACQEEKPRNIPLMTGPRESSMFDENSTIEVGS